MLPVYVRVSWEEGDDRSTATFTVSPIPSIEVQGEISASTNAKAIGASSYIELCSILTTHFQISPNLIPEQSYFAPTASELESFTPILYRTIPEGLGEPPWQTKARNALINALEEADFSVTGRIELYGEVYHSIEEVKRALKVVAEDASDYKGLPSDAYQPDYERLITAVLSIYLPLLDHLRLPRKARRLR